jgi:hypothetical protein
MRHTPLSGLRPRAARFSARLFGVSGVAIPREWPGPEDPADLARRNRRTALVLIGWIALLVLASIIVIWVRN